MCFGVSWGFEHFIVKLTLKLNWKAKKIPPQLATLWFIDNQKLPSRDKKIWVLRLYAAKPWIYQDTILYYWWKNIIIASYYPKLPNMKPRYPNKVPWDQIFVSPKFVIKLRDFFILYIFHDSKLFWLRHATSEQKQKSLGAGVESSRSCSLYSTLWVE